jgi:hypothetical protein
LALPKACSLWKCCTFLHDYNTAAVAETFAVLPSHVLEGIALFATWLDASCAALVRDATLNGMGKIRLNKEKIEEVLVFAEVGNIFAKTCASLSEMAERMVAFRLRHKAAGASALTVKLGELGVTMNSTAIPAAGTVLELAMRIPYLYPSSFTSMALGAELVLLMGARHTDAIRDVLTSDFQMIAEALGHSITAANPHATSLPSKLMLVESELRRMQPPDNLNFYAASPIGAYVALSEKLRFTGLRPDQREDWLRMKLPVFLFRFPQLEKLAAALDGSCDLFVAFKALSMTRLKKLPQARAPAEMLAALELSLAKGDENLVYCIAKYTGQELLTALAQTDTDFSLGDGKPGNGDTLPGKGTVGTLLLSERETQNVVESSVFLEGYDALSKLITTPKDETHINRAFEIICTDGLLICWQLLLRHKTLRRVHEFLNMLTTYRPILPARLGYCLTVGSDCKRKGFAQTFRYDADQLELFTGGSHSQLSVYRKGYLAVLMAIQKADSIDASIEECDWIYDGDHFLGVKDFLHRLTIGFGYNATPTAGVSVATLFELLGKYRVSALESTGEEKDTMLLQLYSWFQAALEESGPYLLEQLDEISPVDKRLQGFLPPQTETTGVIHEIREALDTQSQVTDFRKRAPQLFTGRAHVITGGQGGLRKRDAPGEEDDTEVETGTKKKKKALAEGEANLPKIGRRKALVKWLSDDYFSIGDTAYGPISGLAQLAGVAPKARCWPVMVSDKPALARCTLCSEPGAPRHLTRDTLAHKAVVLPADWKAEHTRPAQGFVVPPPREAAAGGEGA